MFPARPFLALGLTGLFLAGIGGRDDASAQQIYRSVGPDGKVTFSDKPPLTTTAKAAAAPVVGLPAPAGGATANLPFELRQAANRFPVTLYTAPGCAPCGSGRAMLASRGVPFTEKTVTTNEDIDALKRIAGAPSLPFMTIGGQQLKGYSDTEWTQFLDAAGYPKTSRLPAGYNQAAATPLVSAQEPKQASAPLPAPTPVATDAGEPPPADPSGIRF